jgi:hypothetical protein
MVMTRAQKFRNDRGSTGTWVCEVRSLGASYPAMLVPREERERGLYGKGGEGNSRTMTMTETTDRVITGWVGHNLYSEALCGKGRT